MVVATALVGGLWPAVLAAVLSGLALNFFFVPPDRHPDHRRPGERVRHRASSWSSASRWPRWSTGPPAGPPRPSGPGPRPTRWPCWRTACCTPATTRSSLLAQACEVFGMIGAAVLRAVDGQPSRSDGRGLGRPADVERGRRRRSSIEPGVALVLRGRPLRGGRPEPAHRVRRPPRGAARSAAGRRRTRPGRPELAEGNRTRTALLAAVSHDLRSPLAAIKAAVHQPAQHRHRLVGRGRAGAAGHRSRSPPTGWTTWSATCWT